MPTTAGEGPHEVTELQALRGAVEALSARVRDLEDRLEITQLVARYGPAADVGDGEEAAALWAPDGVFDVVGRFRLEGREQIAAMLHGRHQELVRRGCAHVLTPPSVELAGDRAYGLSYSLNLQWDAGADRFRVARVSANRWRWVRTPDGWRVAERINANLDGTPEHRALLTSTEETTAER